MKVNKKRKFNISAKAILITCTVICIVLIVVSFKYQDSVNSVKTSVGNIMMPMQKSINSIGSSIYSVFGVLQSKRGLLDENEKLKDELNRVKQENATLITDKNELSSLRELYKLDEGYSQYPKVAARVISHDDNNWYNLFTIDKGSDEGIEKDMNVIAGNGLVGIVCEVGKHYSKVRSIIDDNSYVNGMFVRTLDTCDIKGNLQTINDGYIEVERISIDAEIEDGYELVTSYESDRFLEGILIGYVSNIESDSNNLTKKARVTPVVDFNRLDTVLVIMQTKDSGELEEMTKYD